MNRRIVSKHCFRKPLTSVRLFGIWAEREKKKIGRVAPPKVYSHLDCDYDDSVVSLFLFEQHLILNMRIFGPALWLDFDF